ncbi:hypothetical protein D3C74_99570 [compost metagenome]
MDNYNSKGYPDPTAAEALINVAREEKATKAFNLRRIAASFRKSIDQTAKTILLEAYLPNVRGSQNEDRLRQQRMDKKWKNSDISWKDFCSRVSVTMRTTEMVDRQMSKDQQASVKDVGDYIAGHLRGGRRKKGYVPPNLRHHDLHVIYRPSEDAGIDPYRIPCDAFRERAPAV